MVFPKKPIQIFHLVLWCLLLVHPFQAIAGEPPLAPKTKIVVADLLEIEGEFYIVRGERGEIRIEVTDDTTISEEFTFGDRIKVVLLPNDIAQSIVRAEKGEPTGITTLTQPAPAKTPSASAPSETKPPTLHPALPRPTTVRVIVADLLMVDGPFYIVRSEHGEIQIEITPQTELERAFKFGDRIHARVTETDRALSVVEAKPDEKAGVFPETALATPSTPEASIAAPSTGKGTPTTDSKESKKEAAPAPPKIRTIVADVLMPEGDFLIVQGERGEIRLEITPKTQISETFDFGDRVKATVLPNNKALTIERASPTDIPGIQ